MVGTVQRMGVSQRGQKSVAKEFSKKEENKGMQGWNRSEEQEVKDDKEKERKKNIIKDLTELRNLNPSWENQISVQIMGDSNPVVN